MTDISKQLLEMCEDYNSLLAVRDAVTKESVEEYIASIGWGDAAEDRPVPFGDAMSLARGCIRGFAAHLRATAYARKLRLDSDVSIRTQDLS